MSTLSDYIKTTLTDPSFSSVKEHFTSNGCRVVDEGNNYIILPPSDIPESVFSVLSHAVGTILTKDTNNLVCYGFPKTRDYTPETTLNGNIVASEYIDGSLIRAFHDGTMWRLSTNGVINAYNSFWISDKSFGELFDDCLSRIYKEKSRFSESKLAKMLDPTCSYQFILSHPSVHLIHSICSKTPKSFLYHVGTYSNKEHAYVSSPMDKHIHSPKTEVVSSLAELQVKLPGAKGYILYSEADKATQSPRYKLLSPEYLGLRKLIGNTPNLYLRYLECLAEGTSKELLYCFPNLRFYSSWIDKCLGEISRIVFGAYVDKFMKKNKEMYINYFLRPLLYEIHGDFMKSQERVTYETVFKKLTSYHPKRINFILNGLGKIKTGDVELPTVDENHVKIQKDVKEDVKEVEQKEVDKVDD
jgi:hypothetical protein